MEQPRNDSRARMLLGIALLACGVLLLVSRTGLFDLDFEKVAGYLLLLAGGFKAITGFAVNARPQIFWGTSVFLFAVMVLLVSYGPVPGDWQEIWPSVLMIPGLAMLMVYFSNRADFRLLSISAALVVISIIGMMAMKIGFSFGDNLVEALTTLLPVAVILAGVYVMRRSMMRVRRGRR